MSQNSTEVFSTEVVKGNTGLDPRVELKIEDPSDIIRTDGRARSWCFTSYLERQPQYNEKDMLYLIVGSEICPSTKRHHWQCYVTWREGKTMSAIKKYFKENSLHLEIANGSARQNKRYCSKDGNFFEYGDLPTPGKRTDLVKLKDEILKGKTVNDIVIEDPMAYHQYGRTLDKIEVIRYNINIRKVMTKGIWLWGETGTGKTHKVFTDNKLEDIYTYPYEKGEWWDGYKQQKVVLFDDFRGQVQFNFLLRLVDKHPNCKVPQRCKEPMNFVSEVVYITSSMHPKDVFKHLEKGDNINQLFRRFEIINIKKV